MVIPWPVPLSVRVCIFTISHASSSFLSLCICSRHAWSEITIHRWVTVSRHMNTQTNSAVHGYLQYFILSISTHLFTQSFNPNTHQSMIQTLLLSYKYLMNINLFICVFSHPCICYVHVFWRKNYAGWSKCNTLVTEIQCVYAFRTLSTHYKDPAVSLRISHKIDTSKSYRNQRAPKFSKGKMIMIRQWQHWPISGCDTFWDQARTSTQRHEHSIEWMCVLYIYKCSINQ
jgi:hypothetical protein